MALPLLYQISDVREWRGTPSVTQCIRGTVEAALDIRTPYAVRPTDRSALMLGTKTHSRIEKQASIEDPCIVLLEHRMTYQLPTAGKLTGALDLVYRDETPDGGRQLILCDYKTTSSYALRRKLGWRTVERPDPTGAVFKQGPRKGMPKTVTAIEQGEPEMREWEWQLNMYRIMLEATVPDTHVDRLVVQAILKDSPRPPLDRGAYLIDITMLPDEDVIEYFDQKAKALHAALEAPTVTGLCEPEERWEDDRKCREYCDVAQYCEHGRQYQLVEAARGDD
jgi:hypothetical protein